MSDACSNCGEGGGSLELCAPPFDADSRRRPFELRRCGRCDLVTTRGVDEAVLAEAYAPRYYGAGGRKFHALLERLLAVLARRRARALLARWREAGGTGPATVCDLGCGRGVLLKAFRALGADVIGIERSREPVDADIADAVHVGTLEDEALEGRRFDIVVVWHVLEHLLAPDAVLDAIEARCREGALLAVAVPNYSGRQRRLFGAAWFHLDLPRHVVHFEAEKLVARLEARGFELLEVRHFDPVQDPYGFVQSALNALLPHRRNELYERLKGGMPITFRSLPALLVWLCAAALLAVPALAEGLVCALRGRGATVRLIARKRITA